MGYGALCDSKFTGRNLLNKEHSAVAFWIFLFFARSYIVKQVIQCLVTFVYLWVEPNFGIHLPDTHQL